MQTEKMSLAGISDFLTRDELKAIMAGSGDGVSATCSTTCPNGIKISITCDGSCSADDGKSVTCGNDSITC